MKRRPVVIAAVVFAGIIALFRMFGIPLRAVPGDRAYADLMVKHRAEVTIRGTVKNWDSRGDYSVVTLKKCEILIEEADSLGTGGASENVDRASGTSENVGRASSAIENSSAEPLVSDGASTPVKTLQIGGVRLNLNGRDSRMPIGRIVTLRGELRAIEGAENPGQFDFAEYYRNQGIYYSLKNAQFICENGGRVGPAEWMAGMKRRLISRIRSIFPEKEAGIVAAVLIGDRSLIDEEEKSLWQTGGILHMLSISGMHLTLLGMGLFMSLRKMGVRLRAAACVSGLFMAFYTVFTGMSLSTVRALIMCMLIMTAKIIGRTYDMPTAIAAAAILMLLENPYYLFYSGFQLSFGALIITCLFGHRGKLTTGVMLFLGMMPVLLSTSSQLSLYSPLVNLIAVPFLPMILLTGAIGTAAGSLAGGLLSLPAKGLLTALHAFLARVSELPSAALILGKPDALRIIIFYAALCAWAYLMKRWRLWKKRFFLYLFVPFLVMIIGLRVRTGLTMTFLSVGQGDSIVLELPSGINCLVDGGSSSVKNAAAYRIEPFVKAEGISTIQYLFVTHMDEDHVEALRDMITGMKERRTGLRIETVVLPYLASEMEASGGGVSSADWPDSAGGVSPVDWLDSAGTEASADETGASGASVSPGGAEASPLMRFAALAEEAGCRVIFCSKGDRFVSGETVIEVLGPDPLMEGQDAGASYYASLGVSEGQRKSGTDSNAQCLVLSVHYREFDALLTGDVTGAGEESLISILRKAGKNYDLLKAAHHGSKYSTPSELLNIIRPAVSVISCGADNRYGHPHRELLERLQKSGTEVFRTDEDGAVTVRTDGYRISVSTFVRRNSS